MGKLKSRIQSHPHDELYPLPKNLLNLQISNTYFKGRYP
jgi:hypothetical protein